MIRQSVNSMTIFLGIVLSISAGDWCSDSLGVDPTTMSKELLFIREGGSKPFTVFLDTTDTAFSDPTAGSILHKGRTILLEYIRTGQFGQFKAFDNKIIRYVLFAPPDGVPVRAVMPMIHGFQECFLDFSEMLYNFRFLREKGFAFALADLRGHGFSDRLLDDPQRGHVNRFDDYLRDHKTFMDILIKKFGSDVPYVLYGHSLGGWIAARYCETYPEQFAGCILSAPMLNFHTGFPDWLEGMLIACGTIFGRNRYTLGQKPWVPWQYESHFLSDCPERIRYKNFLRCIYPEVRLGGATWNWVYRGVKACRNVLKKQNASRLQKIDLLILEAPDDHHVQPEYNEKLVRYAGGEIRRYYSTSPTGMKIGAQHQLYDHREEIRDKVIGDIVAFLEEMSVTGSSNPEQSNIQTDAEWCR